MHNGNYKVASLVYIYKLCICMFKNDIFPCVLNWCTSSSNLDDPLPLISFKRNLESTQFATQCAIRLEARHHPGT